MNRVEIFIITKNEGTLIHKYDILGIEDERDEVMSGFLSALNNFASEIGFPSGVSLIRSGSLEARYSPGKDIFSVLIIDFSMPLGLMTEPILSGLANEVTHTFENEYKKQLEEARKSHVFKMGHFKDFRKYIDKIINQYGDESFQLYQKLILIEAMYAKVPQKHCIPLIERVSSGENVLKDFGPIIKKYPNMKNAIEKVNFNNAPVWEIFAIPTYRI